MQLLGALGGAAGAASGAASGGAASGLGTAATMGSGGGKNQTSGPSITPMPLPTAPQPSPTLVELLTRLRR